MYIHIFKFITFILAEFIFLSFKENSPGKFEGMVIVPCTDNIQILSNAGYKIFTFIIMDYIKNITAEELPNQFKNDEENNAEACVLLLYT